MNTKVIKIEKDVGKYRAEIEVCAEIIKNGGLVVFPTETVYGLGANALDALGAEKIYKAKGRPSDNPLIIHISDPRDAELFTYTSDIYYKLAQKFMPGPLTVVMPSKEIVPARTRAGLPTVAVRCPSHPIARELIRLCGVPIAAPSANLSGSPSPTRASHVIDDMLGRVDVIIDGGDCDIGLESTIVKIELDGSLTLLRPGRITPEQLEAICGKINIASAVTAALKDGEIAESPGMKYRHYAPTAPLYLLDGTTDKVIEYIKSKSDKRHIAVIAYEDDAESIKAKVPSVYIYKFGERSNEVYQSHVLFDILRDADKLSFDEIYAPLPSCEGIGLALYNRMIRAAAHQIIRL
jgi:L-threonylcarbamoyladenylate synthase